MSEEEEEARRAALSWAWELRLTARHWERAREAVPASLDSPEAEAHEGLDAAEALRRRDTLRIGLAKPPPRILADGERAAEVLHWGAGAVSLLAQASWELEQAQVTGDPARRQRGRELLRLADAAMEGYQQRTQALLAAQGIDADAPPLR